VTSASAGTDPAPPPGTREPAAAASGASPAGILGMRLFLASLGTLFAASLVLYVIVRQRTTAWPPEGLPRLPDGLGLSTAILIFSSITMHVALFGVRAGSRIVLQVGLVLTAVLGVLFLANQLHSWWHFLLLDLPRHKNLYAFTFYVLAALHGLHVFGGLFVLGITTAKAFRRRYTPAYHPGVCYCTMYWHFLDVVWLVIFVTLLIFA